MQSALLRLGMSTGLHPGPVSFVFNQDSIFHKNKKERTMQIKKEEIVGIYVSDEELLCPGCYGSYPGEITADIILTSKEVENSDNLFFCDGCKKQITVI